LGGEDGLRPGAADVYVVRRRPGLVIYGEVEAVPPPAHGRTLGIASTAQDGHRLPAWPDYWLEGQWYSVRCVEGVWGRVDPLQPDVQEISKEDFEKARSLGWREAPPS
jgi:hypothetical protein